MIWLYVIVYKLSSHRPSQVKDEIYIYNLTDRVLHRLAPDFVGAASLSGKLAYPWLFVTLTGFTTPGTVAQYDFSKKDEDERWSIIKTTVVRGLIPDDFETQQVRSQFSGHGAQFPRLIRPSGWQGVVQQQGWNESPNVYSPAQINAFQWNGSRYPIWYMSGYQMITFHMG